MQKDNIVILKENNEAIGEEVYKLLGRALINSFGVEACKLLIEKFKYKENKHK